MADTKITALTAISTVDPAIDVLPIVDVSDTTMAASGTTKKITSNQILGSGGTATLASATITGDLTVDTSTLKVDSTNNRVGIGTVTPLSKLHIGSGIGLNNLGVGLSMGATANFYEAFDGTKTLIVGTDSSQAGVKVGSLTNHPLYLASYNTPQLEITHPGVFVFNDGLGGTRMTLNSTGLGVGVTPSAGKFEVLETGTGSGLGGIFASTATAGGNAGFVFRTASTNRWSISLTGTAGSESIRFYDANAAATRMTLDASGNLNLGDPAGNVGRLFLRKDSLTNTVVELQNESATGKMITFHTNGFSQVGSITFTNSAVAYNTSSDYRLKESVKIISGGLARVNALKPSAYKWKVDGSNGEGFLAHELAEVVPFAVTGDKDAVDADGKPAYQGVDLSKVVPILVAAIQELTAEVNALKNA